MKIIDTVIRLRLKKEFTPLKDSLNKLIKENNLVNANIVCWVPHEVSSIVQLGWEAGLLDDLRDYLEEMIPSGKWKHHDEPGTAFRHNFFEHIRTKLVGDVSKTFIIKDGRLVLGKYQDLYFYSPVWKEIPNQKVDCRILKFS